MKTVKAWAVVNAKDEIIRNPHGQMSIWDSKELGVPVLIVPLGKWTSEMPMAPGWYFYKDDDLVDYECVPVFFDGEFFYFGFGLGSGEPDMYHVDDILKCRSAQFYPQPIHKPPTESLKAKRPKGGDDAD